LKRFVLDASIALAWFLDNPVSPYALRVKQALVDGARAVVPALWHLEMANGLVVAERRRILATAEGTRCLQYIEQLTSQIETNNDLVPARQALTTARSFQLSAYDAVYLDTARNEGLPLATLDQSMRAAAGRAGVEIFQ
jgi:predicted nucleic acid-binding protein